MLECRTPFLLLKYIFKPQRRSHKSSQALSYTLKKPLNDFLIYVLLLQRIVRKLEKGAPLMRSQKALMVLVSRAMRDRNAPDVVVGPRM